VVYMMAYKDNAGIAFLTKAGIAVTHIPELG
jgi:hypothetical protein